MRLARRIGGFLRVIASVLVIILAVMIGSSAVRLARFVVVIGGFFVSFAWHEFSPVLILSKS